MDIEVLRKKAKRNMIRGIGITLVCGLFLVVTLLKTLYYVSDNNSQALGASTASSIVANLYNAIPPVQWLWPFAPTFTPNELSNLGNIMTLLLICGLFAGLMLIISARDQFRKLADAESRARDEMLKEEFKKRATK